MVTGFETITKPLTPYEQQVILPYVIKAWLKKPYAEFDKKGKMSNEKEALVNMIDMISGVNKAIFRCNQNREKPMTYMNAPRMRKIIQHIRQNALVPHLIATSKGYYKTKDQERLKNYVKSCKERANAFLATAQALESQFFVQKPTVHIAPPAA